MAAATRSTRRVNNFVKQAYDAGAQQALQDAGITKTATWRDQLLLRAINPLLGAGMGAVAGGEDNRLLGALAGGALGHLGGRAAFTFPGAVVGGLAGGAAMNMLGPGDPDPTLMERAKGVFA